MADWVDTFIRRDARDRRADADVSQSLPLLGAAQMQALKRWASKERDVCRRQTLLKEAEPASIEEVEVLRERLLAEAWIECREQLKGGVWRWESLRWRDLPRLQGLLGIENASGRARRRDEALAQAAAWLAQNTASLESDALQALQSALADLSSNRESDRAMPLATLLARLDLLRALVDWQVMGLEGSQRDFALHAKGDTKAVSAAEWRWLGQAFDLERWRISPFVPMLAVSGSVSLHWDDRRIDLDALHFVQLPLSDARRVVRVSGAMQGWWLIENRASFERQARLARDASGEIVSGRRIITWLPGRPSQAWLAAWAHLLRLFPAPVAISADADPAGVDIACTVGALCEQAGVPWLPEQMGVAQLEAATQQWPLNEHDDALLLRLLARPGLPVPLRLLCEAMQGERRKAEQEGWL